MAKSGVGLAFRRSWRKLRTSSTAVQAGVAGLAVIVIAGAAVGIAVAATGGSGNTTSSSSQSGFAGANGVGVDQASTSSRGVTSDTINVVFPIVNITLLSQQEGFAGDQESTQVTQAIHTFVNAINASGGINGRRINAMIKSFDPTNEAQMRADCKDWTESTPVFAVVDGLGAWNGDNQLCIAQEGQTPFIGQWTTVTDWTQKGSPYLWWTGVDQSVMLKTLVAWGQSAHLLGGNMKVGVLAGSRASDQLALNKYLIPDMRAAGLPPPDVQTMSASLTDVATLQAEAPLVVQRFKSDGVQSVIPLIPFPSLYPYLQSETQQNYFPKLLLSDYESSILLALGLIPAPYEQALDGQQGISVETLGGIDDDRPQSQGGYDPGLRACWNTWKAHNKVAAYNQPGHFIEEQGPIASWCQAIQVFATAVKKAGPDLNRRTFVQAMASIKDFPGTLTPTLSYGPNKFFGPVEYQVIRIHNNDPNNNACVVTYTGKPQGTCWQIVQGYKPLVTS